MAQLCYGNKSSTGTVRRLFHQKSYDSTALVRRSYGARMSFGRVIEGKMTSVGVCTHRTGTGRFLYKKNYRTIPTVRCPAGHRTMSDKRQEHYKNLLTNRSMKSADELPPVRRDVFSQMYILHLYRYISLLKSKNINTKIYISLEQLSNYCSLEQVWFPLQSMSESDSIFFILTTCFFGGMMAIFI